MSESENIYKISRKIDSRPLLNLIDHEIFV
uniref:Uncharacterized protein n=1 Tax=Myoviridae sp. ctTRu92 TaxID=2825111 RepID=A0A8S5Q5K8_9CAUD|nr:MAG TPA: hypothetical protein [Myoviridae sp. ctTRu92]